MMSGIESQVLKRITPSEKESREVSGTVQELTILLRKEIAARGLNIEPILVGSVAKGTHLSGTDLDIFLMFSPETPREELERLGLELGRRFVKGEERYAEHPYIHGEFKGYTVDIVPCYKIERVEERLSAVDRTPFHTQYMLKNLKEGQRAEVRLLKRFMKGIGVYGAEAEIEGFSGYMCELLVLRHGTFRGVLEEARNWRPGQVLKLDERGNGSDFGAPLIFIDPVDVRRNAASAVSLKNLVLFSRACEEYVRGARVEFFFPKKRRALSQEKLRTIMKKRVTAILGIHIPKPDLVPDVLFPQVRKAERAIVQLCESEGFKVMNSSSSVKDNIQIMLEFETPKLPLVKKHTGPPAWVKKNAESFIEKWKNDGRKLAGPYLDEQGYWVVEIEREWADAEKMLRSNPNLSLGKNINEIVLRKGFSVLNMKELLNKYPAAVAEFVTKKFPWES